MCFNVLVPSELIVNEPFESRAKTKTISYVLMGKFAKKMRVCEYLL